MSVAISVPIVAAALVDAEAALTAAGVETPRADAEWLLAGILYLGAGIGLAVRGGAVLDGTEIAALLISKRGHILKVGDIILVFNVAL